MKKNILVFLALLLSCGQVFAEEAKTTIEKYLNSITSFEAYFSQSLITQADGIQETSKGKFYLSRPGKFRWDYSQPFEQSIIADGKKIWIYDQDLEQVTVREMSDVLSNTPALLLSSEVSISDEFNVSRIKDREKNTGLEWFVLSPKAADQQYIDISLAFRDSNLAMMELRDSFGQLTKIIFTGQKRNQTIDQRLFNFTPPEGVDVLNTALE